MVIVLDVETSTLAHLIAAFKKAGADVDALSQVLEKCDLPTSSVIRTSESYPAEREAKFVAEACDALGDVTFGAQAGLSRRAYRGLSEYIGKYSKTLRSAIEHTSRFHDVDSPALGWALRVSGNSAALELFWKDPSFARFHRYVEFAMFAALARIRSTIQTDFFPLEIRFVHEVHKSASEFQKLAGCPVVFGAESFEMILPLPALDLPIPSFDTRLQEHLIEYGRRLLREEDPACKTLRSRVEGLLVSALPARILNADEVAASVGLSRRSFDRRLKKEGTSFRAVVDNLRCDLARTFMQDDMAFSEIAFALGYADQASFSTAFKRWTGEAPRAYKSKSQLTPNT